MLQLGSKYAVIYKYNNFTPPMCNCSRVTSIKIKSTCKLICAGEVMWPFWKRVNILPIKCCYCCKSHYACQCSSFTFVRNLLLFFRVFWVPICFWKGQTKQLLSQNLTKRLLPRMVVILTDEAISSCPQSLSHWLRRNITHFSPPLTINVFSQCSAEVAIWVGQ